MKNNLMHNSHKVFRLDAARGFKKPSTIRILKDSKRAAQAIATRTCLICGEHKVCINKAGVCALCYDTVLTPEERAIATEEAKHKIIKLVVTDDRWKE